MVADEFVDEDDLVIDGGRQSIRLSEEVVFGIILDRANKCSLLPRRKALIMGDFLEATKNVRAMSTEDVNFGPDMKAKEGAKERYIPVVLAPASS